jgi:DNA polymerase III subunit epsilon
MSLGDWWRRQTKGLAGAASRSAMLGALDDDVLAQSPEEVRWVVADVESSGLNPNKDSLIAIGAVAVVNGQISLSDSFEMVIKQTVPSSDANILIHRIGGDAQLNGDAARDVLQTFAAYVGASPLVGYHAGFDEAMLLRAYRDVLNVTPRREWLDLASLAPAIVPAEGKPVAPPPKSLDGWLARFGVEIELRHNAAADAFGTAQLLQTLLPFAKNRKLNAVASVLDEARAQAWLARGRSQ